MVSAVLWGPCSAEPCAWSCLSDCYLQILNKSVFEFMFCKKSDGTTEYTLRFAALLHAESCFLLPLSNEILTAYSRDPVVLATEAPSQCPFLGPIVSSAHGRREGLVWTHAGQGQVSLLCRLVFLLPCLGAP